jgi:hypothetical protein
MTQPIFPITGMTREQYAAISVTSAFDSVNLINTLNAKESLTQDETDTKTVNINHLKIMMTKDWFDEALTSEQRSDIQALIV